MEWMIGWLALIIVMLIIEGLTLNMGTLCLAIGGAVSLVLSLCGLDIYWQIGAFLVVSALALIFLRPLARKMLKNKIVKTNADRVIGQRGLVLKEIKAFSPGLVKADGKEWTAISKHQEEAIAAGEEVKVLAIEGVKLVVEKMRGEVE